MSKPVVGFVGLGNMGSALARNLVDAGFRLCTHDMAGPGGSPTGAEFVNDIATVAAGAQTVVLSLPDGAAVMSVVKSLLDAPQRSVQLIIDTSTIGLDAAGKIAAMASEAGLGYVDAPVSGGPAGARARTLTVMYAGEPGACTAAQSVLAGLSDRRYHVGERPGLGQVVKLANNFLSATALAATSEAMAFGTSVGVDPATMLEVLNASSGRSAASSDKFVDHVLTERYASGFTNTLMAKDLRLYLEAVEARGSSAVLGRVSTDIWQVFARAEPRADFTRIYPHVRSTGETNE